MGIIVIRRNINQNSTFDLKYRGTLKTQDIFYQPGIYLEKYNPASPWVKRHKKTAQFDLSGFIQWLQLMIHNTPVLIQGFIHMVIDIDNTGIQIRRPALLSDNHIHKGSAVIPQPDIKGNLQYGNNIL